MRTIFYYIWLGLAMVHPYFSKIFIPMNWIIMKSGRKTEEDYINWKKNFNKGVLDFPGGINDWFAYGILVLLFLIPVIVVSVKYKIDIYTNKYYFGIIAVTIGVFCYYWIYIRCIGWLKEKINEVSKKYYLK